MKRLLAFALVAPAALGQTLPDRVSSTEVRSGEPQGWTAQAISLAYEVPEPVGRIEFEFAVSVEPLNPRNGLDRLRLTAGSIGYRDGVTIDLPRQLLECLPLPRPREAGLSTLYIEPSDNDADWFSQFTSYITIQFGQPNRISLRDTVFLEYANVEFSITGNALRRAVFTKATGERRVLSPVSDSCPSELVNWAIE